MIILPDCEIKPLSGCEAGKLIRLVNNYSNGEFALVADLNEGKGRALVQLQKGAPVYLILDQPAQLNVLASSSDVIFEVDQHGPYYFIDQGRHDISGCVICIGTRWLLDVQKSNQQFRTTRKQYDLKTFRLVEVSGEYLNIAIFGKWSLSLRSRDTLREKQIKIAAF